MTHYYCTYFDRNYMVKGLALVESLQRTDPDSHIYVVCLDEITRTILNLLKPANVSLLALHEVEAGDSDLIEKKYTRTEVEYYWTLTPSIIRFILKTKKEIDIVTYVDADLYFYSSPAPIFSELGDKSVLIHEHRYSPTLRQLEPESGRFNVGLLCFRNNEDSRLILNTWRDQCLEWCYNRYEDGRMGDQLYLNDWPEKYDSVVVLENIGAGVAPWNHGNYEFTKINDEVFVSGIPLIFYHFHAFSIISDSCVVPATYANYPIVDNVLKHVAMPYISSLFEIYELVKRCMSSFEFGFKDSVEISNDHVLILRGEANNLVKKENYRTIQSDEWTIRIPLSSNNSVVDKASISSNSSSLLTSSVTNDISQYVNLRQGESIHNYMERLYISDHMKNIFFIGVHMFEERDWFFSNFQHIENMALFEPIPHVYNQLSNSLQADNRIKVYPFAVSDEVGKTHFNVSNNLYSSSLLPMKEHLNIFPHVNMDGEIEVEQVTLQYIVDELGLTIPDLLFIDVQGAEYMVLTGLDKSLLSRVKMIYTEVSTVEMYEGARLLDDIIEYLSDDFIFIGYQDMANTGVHGDALFVSKEFLNELSSTELLSLQYNKQGEAAYAENDIDNAYNYFLKAVAIWPYNSEIYNNLGILAWRCQDTKTALEYLQIGLQKNPADPIIIKNIQDIQTQNRLIGSEKKTTNFDLNTELNDNCEKSLYEIKVSAIVSTYNSEEYIAGCLQDLEEQTIASRLEIIVIDSNSTQNEKTIVERFQRQYNNIIYIRTDERETIYQAWNRAIQASHGKYITNANTDDRHHPNAFELMVTTLDNNQDVSLVYADSAITLQANATYDSAMVEGYFNWPEYDQRHLFDVCYIGPHPMWRKSVHEKYGYFDNEMKSAGDYEFWLRLSAHEKFMHIDKVLGLYLYIESSIQNSDQSLSIIESNIARERYWQENYQLPPMSGNYIVAADKNEKFVNNKELKPLISIIMPTYNRPDKLSAAIDSVIAQSFTDWELIIVDDGDGSGEAVVGKYGDNHQIRYIKHEKNMGQSVARNTALRHSKGDVICFLDDDDVIYQDHLQILVNGIKNFSGGVVYTDSVQAVRDCNSSADSYKVHGNQYAHEEYSRERLYVGNYIPINTIAFLKSYLVTTGLFDEELPSLEDWDLLLRLSKVSDFLHIHKTTAEVRIDNNDSSNVSEQGASNYPVVYREIYSRNNELNSDYVKTQRQLTINYIDRMFQGLVT